MLQRKRDLVNSPVTLDYLAQKTAEGWKMEAVEWVRDIKGAAAGKPETGLIEEEVPYGSRLSEDGFHLEQNPFERTLLLLILEKIVREKRITEIAQELNAEGLSTRLGKPWKPSEVFELLPRLIDAGPSLLKSAEWENRRNRTELSH